MAVLQPALKRWLSRLKRWRLLEDRALHHASRTHYWSQESEKEDKRPRLLLRTAETDLKHLGQGGFGLSHATARPGALMRLLRELVDPQEWQEGRP